MVAVLNNSSTCAFGINVNFNEESGLLNAICIYSCNQVLIKKTLNRSSPALLQKICKKKLF